MELRLYRSSLRWVAFVALPICSLANFPGAVLPAFAEAGSGAGAIAGGFFSEQPVLLPVPGLPSGVRSNAPLGNAPLGADAGLCQTAVAQATSRHQLPSGLLGAVAQVESGRLDPRTSKINPWPWTIDANGTGYFYNSEQSAIQAANAFQAAGITSLDIGCLQVNLVQHPDAFQTLAQAFDPAANADYAAGFLTSLEQKFGSWPPAVAAYHSQTAVLGQPYAAKVYAAWQGTPGAPLLASAAVDSQAGLPAIAGPILPAFALGASAPPMAILTRRGPAPTGRGLAAYRAAPVLIATRLAPQG